MNEGDRADGAEEPSPAAEAVVATSDSILIKRKRIAQLERRASSRGRDKRMGCAPRGASCERRCGLHCFLRDLRNSVRALRSANCNGWKTEMKEDIDALEDNGVRRMTERSPSTKALHSKGFS
uniref:Uncharacterized protein n=1 Tax=Peronospora matthiolae TaxID=2874970 RepID=A0AAV1TA57_9STRA